MGTTSASAASSGQRVFRLAYASRVRAEYPRDTVVRLAADAASNNVSNQVSGVLYSDGGVFVQWLEGPSDGVCSLMSRIEADPRHRDVTVLGAGWMTERRFARWPMRLADLPLPSEGGAAGLPTRSTPCDASRAMAAFDLMSEAYRREKGELQLSPVALAGLARRLMLMSGEPLSALPDEAAVDLGARARLVDDVCATFMAGWRDDSWTSHDIAVGMAELTRLWRRTGRIDDPVDARHGVAIVVPPGATELLGAVVKADILRAAGTSVRMVLESNTADAIAALSGTEYRAIIVSGSRVGWSADQDRAEAFAETARRELKGVPVHIGGRPSGPIRECADRFAFCRDTTDCLPAEQVDWLALTALATVVHRRNGTRPTPGGDPGTHLLH